MPILFVRNLQPQVVGLNSTLGDLSRYEERSRPVTTNELEEAAPILLDLQRKGIIVFSVEETPETDDDAIEGVRREELFGNMPRARWVSQAEGNDTIGDGSLGSPYLTIERALEDYVPASRDYDPTDWQVFVVWVIPPFTASSLFLRVPRRWGTKSDSISPAMPASADLYVAAWNGQINDTTDPRWSVLKGPLTPITATLRENRYLYTFTAGTFTEPDDFYLGRHVRIFSGGVERTRGAVVYHESFGESLAIHTNDSAAPTISDEIYIVEPACQINGLLGITGPADTCVRLLGFKVEGINIERGACIELAGTEVRNTGLGGFSTIEMSDQTNVVLAAGTSAASAFASQLEALGLPAGESDLWLDWCSSVVGQTPTSRCISSLKGNSSLELQGVSVGEIIMDNGHHDLRIGGSIRGFLTLANTWIWYGAERNPYFALDTNGIQMSNCTAFFGDTIVVDIGRTSGSVLRLWGSKFFRQDSNLAQFVPWDASQDTLTGVGAYVVDAQEMSGLRVNAGSTVFGQVLGQDLRAGTLTTDWATLPLIDNSELCLIK